MSRLKVRRPEFVWLCSGALALVLAIELFLFLLPFDEEHPTILVRVYAAIFYPFGAFAFLLLLFFKLRRVRFRTFAGMTDFFWFGLKPLALAVLCVEALLIGFSFYLGFVGNYSALPPNPQDALLLVGAGTFMILVAGLPVAALSFLLLSKVILAENSERGERSLP